MLCCLFCQEENPAGERQCRKCSAKLPAVAVPVSPTSSLDLSEGFKAPEVPLERYYTDLMYDFSWSAHELVEEDGDLDPFLDVFDEIQERFEQFDTGYEELRASLLSAQAEYPGEDGPQQALYLIKRGREFYRQGIDKINDCVESDSADGLMEGVGLIMDGSDHITHCMALLSD